MPRPLSVLGLAALLGAATILAACSSDEGTFAFPIPSIAPSPAPPPPPEPPPPKPIGPPGRLSGLPTRPGSPVLAVKVDATSGARPQAGVGQADVVYVEQVEGGLTRFLAVFNSRLPARVGPVRSVRTDNVDLLAQYGAIAFAYSGGQPAALSVVQASSLVDDGFDRLPGQYAVDPGRGAPYNLFIDPEALLAVRKGDGARDTGLRFNAAKPPKLGAGGTVSLAYPSAQYVFTYDKSSKSYRVTQDGTPLLDDAGKAVEVANVVVQRVVQITTGLKDIAGNFTPANLTTGEGDVTVFRDGHPVEGTWSRPEVAAPTRWRTARGADISLRPGSTWVLLAPAFAPLSAQ